ncbi:DUF4381 domain-containing protein [Candidatus Phyllobacterium onerii]|uniref:DUF4381 domain-containing protein n=1 Tax=Candidatus Phyllobacterium onerii TaxID=3020828 RepID=UPI00232CAA38|nr:DUF4381 domain-containing protein [Phyllobacterium sp. IY22]
MEPQPKLDPLTQTALRSLHDIAVPPPVSWMPHTWGWAVVAIIVIVALLLWFAYIYKRWRRNAYRREALAMLDAIEIDIRNPKRREQAVMDIGVLMKRTALAVWPREDIAAVAGTDWVSFLAAYGTGMGQGLRDRLDDLEYQHAKAMSAEAAEGLVRSARSWIEGHHVSA